MTKNAACPSGAISEGLPKDILIGAQEMAIFLYGEVEGTSDTAIRRVYHAISRGEIPTFKIGGKIHARRSAILSRIEEQERRAAVRVSSEAAA